MNILAIALILAAELGSVSFPTSTKNAAAQAEFERGVAALHSFWYEEAAAYFQRAQKLDPGFAMAYWGEAMTHNHPIWMEQDRDAARAILAKAPPAATPLEADWRAALDVLYGEGEKHARDVAYERALASMAEKYPGNNEVKAFHALAILGTIFRRTATDSREQIRAAAILEPLSATLPNHPGVLHYTIHAYDDPLHAPLGLRAARRYAQVAPSAFHALHMPSHIFLQLGMWKEAAASNEQSYASSKAWVERDKLPGSKRDLHSLQWLHYIYLQQGRRDEARALMAELPEETATSDRERSARLWMTARWIAETGEPLSVGVAGKEGEPVAHCATPSYETSTAVNYANALLAIRRGDSAAANASIALISSARETATRKYQKLTLEIAELTLRAMDLRKQGKLTEALDFAKRATAVEETLGAPSGPPDVLKPSHELHGELLLEAGKPKEALEQFRISLERMPNRAASLRGAAAASSAGASSAP